MTNTIVQQLLDRIEQRERELAEQAGELAARLREVEAERDALAITGKTIRAMATDLELDSPPAPDLPEGAAYQQIMDVFEHEQRALRARDLCLALDLPVAPKHTEARNSNAWPASDSSTRPNPGCSNSPDLRRTTLPPTSAPDPHQSIKRYKTRLLPSDWAFGHLMS